MKKRIFKRAKLVIMIFCILMLCLQTPVFAEAVFYSGSNVDADELDEEYDRLLEASGADELMGELSNEAGELLRLYGIDGVDKEQMLELSFFDVIKTIFHQVKNSFSTPLSMLCCCIGIILLCALLNSMKGAFKGGAYDRAFSVICVVGVAGAVATPACALIIRISEAISAVGSFLISFIPIYSGIITASGKALSGVAYQTALFAVVQVISRISATVFVPLLGVYLAFCLIGSASQELDITGIAKSIKTIVITSLSFLLTIFVGLLSVQGTIAVSADTVGLKTAKFAVSTFLPVVGSAVSEALNSVYGCMGVVKSTVGGFGIIGIFAMLLPSLISALLLQLALFLAEGASSMLETGRITSLLGAARAMVSLLIGILVVFMLLFIVSIAIIAATTSVT